MRTAKELFKASGHLVNFQKFIADPSFDPACHAAMGILLETLPKTTPDPSRAWDAYLQIQGAMKVLDILSRLHEPDEPPKPVVYPTIYQ